ncbi:NLR family CARD domain-containing protein 3-like [Oncorhynchus masou masou]|uniref:NLR family CARD domain-containing protein 3-like n=1 Tax=Oncorhynchus masou masou TaxID=90313 RepID=UPI003184011C
MSLSGEREEGGPASKMSLSGEREEGGPASKMSLSGEREEGGPASKMSLSGEREEGGHASKMSLSGEREEGGPASKMSLSGEREEGGHASKMSLSGEREEGGHASKMSLSGEREEGGHASKMSLSGEHDTNVKRGQCSKMSLSGEREEGGPVSKMHLSGGHDTKAKRPIQQERPASPVPSCVSMKSDRSMGQPIYFRKGDFSTEQRPIQQERPASPVPSCVSMKSHQSMDPPLYFREGDFSTEQRYQQERSESEILSGQSSQSHQTDLGSIFSMLEEKIMTFVKNELKIFKRILSPELPEGFESQKQDKEVVDAEDEQQESSAREGALKITLHILRKMNQKELADTLEKYSDELAVICQRELKSNLKKKFQCVFEGIAQQGNPTLLNKIYTEIYITEGGTGEVNNEHELRQIETTTRKQARPETAIKCNDIFKPLTGQDKPIRTVLTKGVAGIGKTVSVQKFILDWAEGKANQDVQFVFSFPFRELNLMKGDKHTFIELLNHFSMETKQSGISINNKYKVLFIFDGLDECRLPLDFQKNKICWDVTQSTSVDVLLTNLIKGNLLPSALLWITTRPAAANKIPSGCVDQVTEVRGFNDPQKEEYFRKRFSDEDLASRIISHIKTSRSLHIMCHVPVFCWISATVLEHMLKHKREEMPKTLTEMYTHLVEFHTKQKNEKYLGKEETGPHLNKESILSLGKLAFQQLVKGNLIFYEEDLKESGIDVNEASVYSGLCTQLFKEECGLYQDKVYCFVHLSIQEFLAAVYVFLSFINNNENLMDEPQSMFRYFLSLFREKPKVTEVAFYKSAVDKALQSETGNLDLFLRFLLGLSLESNQKHLRGLLTKTRSSSQSHEETVKYFKEKIRENPSPERSINLFHCLNELNDHSLVEEIQRYLRSGSLSSATLSPAQWSALVFVLLTSEKELDVFDLKKYSRSEEGLLRLLPVVKASRAALLSGCGVTEEGCASLVSALRSNPSHLRELDLSNNDLKDSGVKLLSAGLGNPHCKLETLRLSGCLVTDEGCASLVSALESNPSHLRELDLSNNDLKDSGVELLSAGLGNPHCKLETLRLSGCLVTEEGCASLGSALRSNPSHLRELDLSYNHPGDSGVRLLSAGLEDPHCRLEKLNVEHGGENRMKPGLRKYVCDLTLDPNTVNRLLSLSEENRKVTCRTEEQPYPDHPERFEVCGQVLCREGLTGRCYWEVEWSGRRAVIGVTYKGINRRGGDKDCCLGHNDKSWSLFCSDNSYTACHNNNHITIDVPSSSPHRVGVYLDWPAGTLSFYRASSDTLTHLITFTSTFTDPLYPGFRVWGDDSSVYL